LPGQQRTVRPAKSSGPPRGGHPCRALRYKRDPGAKGSKVAEKSTATHRDREENAQFATATKGVRHPKNYPRKQGLRAKNFGLLPLPACFGPDGAKRGWPEKKSSEWGKGEPNPFGFIFGGRFGPKVQPGKKTEIPSLSPAPPTPLLPDLHSAGPAGWENLRLSKPSVAT